MTVTLQIQLEPDRALTFDELCIIFGEMSTLCSKVEKTSYVRSAMFVDQVNWTPEDYL